MTLVVLIILSAEIYLTGKKKDGVIKLSIALFAVHTVIGFFPLATGELFGGMFHTNSLIQLVKNILNVAVIIVFLQAYSWLKNDILKEKQGE